MNNFFKYVLGEVLHVANAYPPIFYKSEFYTLKEKLLKPPVPPFL